MHKGCFLFHFGMQFVEAFLVRNLQGVAQQVQQSARRLPSRMHRMGQNLSWLGCRAAEEFSRLTGDKKYTDKMTITLADTNGKCMCLGA